MIDLQDFVVYLEDEKKTANNTVLAYKRDINAFFNFLENRGIYKANEVNNSHVASYMLSLKSDDMAKATVNRKLASIRGYFSYLVQNNLVKSNPALDIKSPKIEDKEIEYLTIEEVELLLGTPDDSIKGKRDRAILEILYATGVRASELIEMTMKDVNLRMGFISCTGEHSKARIVPMGGIARRALENYILDARPMLLKDKTDNDNVNDGEASLFLNYLGEGFTRQGLWKVLKVYGVKAGLEKTITPQIMRNSFAVHMIQNGADIKSLQELMGHEDISATQVYLSVSKSRIKDVYDKTHPRA